MNLLKLYKDENLNQYQIDEIIDNHIDEWHEGNSKLELHEYLGFTWLEYSQWVKSPSKFFSDKRFKNE